MNLQQLRSYPRLSSPRQWSAGAASSMRSLKKTPARTQGHWSARLKRPQLAVEAVPLVQAMCGELYFAERGKTSFVRPRRWRSSSSVSRPPPTTFRRSVASLHQGRGHEILARRSELATRGAGNEVDASSPRTPHARGNVGTLSLLCPNLCPNGLFVFVQIPRGGASKNRTYDLVIISDAL